MATLYVENVPDDLYEALRKQAKSHRKSIAAEVIELLRTNVPTEKELKQRRQAMRDILAIQRQARRGVGPYQSAEEMLREDRDR